MAKITHMIKQFAFVVTISTVISCTSSTEESDLIEENYTFWNPQTQDSVFCLQIGHQYVNESNTISLTAIHHELVDETPASVKIAGKLINVEKEKIQILVGSDTLIGKLNFQMENLQPFVNLNLITQGTLQTHPKASYEIDGLLILGIQK